MTKTVIVTAMTMMMMYASQSEISKQERHSTRKCARIFEQKFLRLKAGLYRLCFYAVYCVGHMQLQ